MARKRKLPPGLWKRGNVYYARFSAGGRLVRTGKSVNYHAKITDLIEQHQPAPPGAPNAYLLMVEASSVLRDVRDAMANVTTGERIRPPDHPMAC